MKKMLAAAATAALLIGSTAQANSAKALSLSNSPARAATTAGESNQLVGTTAWVLAAIGLGLVVWGVVELTDDDADSN